jgi:outer membrane immunogenic protein
MAIRIALLLSLLLAATLANAQRHYGPYLGGYLAAGKGTADWDVAGTTTKVHHSASGGMGGVQGGFNWQRGALLLGAQADFGIGEVDGSSRCPNPAFQCKTQLLSLITLRGRVGPVIGPAVLYATAGVASGTIRASVDNAAAGAGVGLRASRSIQLQAEYLHVDFASEEHLLQNNSNKIKFSADFVRVGVHYRFF